MSEKVGTTKMPPFECRQQQGKRQRKEHQQLAEGQCCETRASEGGELCAVKRFQGRHQANCLVADHRDGSEFCIDNRCQTAPCQLRGSRASRFGRRSGPVPVGMIEGALFRVAEQEGGVLETDLRIVQEA